MVANFHYFGLPFAFKLPIFEEELIATLGFFNPSVIHRFTGLISLRMDPH